MATLAISPIILVDRDGTALAFPTLEAAESYAEPPTVEDGEYVGYDAEGRRLSIGVYSVVKVLLGFIPVSVKKVRIECVEDYPQHVEDVRSALIDYLSALHGDMNVEYLRKLSLPELVKQTPFC